MFLTEPGQHKRISEFDPEGNSAEGVTVFSKVSKDILNQYNSVEGTRFKKFNKQRAYDMMMNDDYLCRMREKEDSANLHNLYSDFITRNKIMAQKAKEKLLLKAEMQ